MMKMNNDLLDCVLEAWDQSTMEAHFSLEINASKLISFREKVDELIQCDICDLIINSKKVMEVLTS